MLSFCFMKTDGTHIVTVEIIISMKEELNHNYYKLNYNKSCKTGLLSIFAFSNTAHIEILLNVDVW